MASKKTILGIDIGGTKIYAGLVQSGKVIETTKKAVRAEETMEEVLSDLFSVIDYFDLSNCTMIGVGVPGTVDVERGIVFDIQNIPSWIEVEVKKILEDKYGLPVYVNNDANCFTIGEKLFGKGKKYKDFVGLAIGTGLGAGVIIDHHLYTGRNCGAGEFGTIPYKDKRIEYYASGNFFSNVYGISGTEAYRLAQAGDEQVLKYYDELGFYLAYAIKVIMYTIDPEAIILGGSVSSAYPFFKDALLRNVKTFPFSNVTDNLQIEVSEEKESAVLGAVAWCIERAEREAELSDSQDLQVP